MNKKPNIGLIDTGTSNIRSVYYALKESGAEIKEINRYRDSKVDLNGLIIPGIGNFSFVMNKLKDERLDKFIFEKIDLGIPCLFICVGMQILFSQSFEFGIHQGLNILEGEVKKISKKNNEKFIRKVPFIGWNKIEIKKNCEILKNLNNEDFFYFTHSYFVKPTNKLIVSATTNYYDFEYCSSISYKNIFATQFHPEKSGNSGLKIYKNFVGLV